VHIPHIAEHCSPQWTQANRATTSFTLAGHSADFTLSVVQLPFWGRRHLQGLAQTRD